MRRAFLICPVRGVDEKIKEAIAAYVAGLEAKGFKVHWPSRDTNQNDPVGLQICLANRAAIFEADEVHVWFDSRSQGSVFDFGMAFAFSRKIVLANPEEVVQTDGKSFQNVLLSLSGIFRLVEERQE